MATRCNVVIQLGKTSLYLYRHWDGYPSCTGLDLVKKLVYAGEDDYSGSKFIASMMESKREETSYSPASPDYVATNGAHGDVDWVYVIKFSNSGTVRVGWASYPLLENVENQTLLAYAKNNLKSFSEFKEFVDVEVADFETRLASQMD